ncbi:MAG: four helix bundle protein [Flavobacteriales bacterium]
MNSTSLRSFTELKAWQKSRVVRKAISQLVKGFPTEEKYRLSDQIIRSCRGSCSNIAEGYGRFHEKDNARFCRMARGSHYETMDHLSVAYDEEYISKEDLKTHWAMADEAIRVVNGYLRYLTKFDSTGNSASDPQEFYGTEEDIYTDSPEDI